MSFRERSRLQGEPRARIDELAAARRVTHSGILCRLSHTTHDRGRLVLAVREYSLAGTSRSVAFRARDVQRAFDPDAMRRYIAPRLEAMFEDIWWRKSVVLMTAGDRDGREPDAGTT